MSKEVATGVRCPYCGKRGPRELTSKCFFCDTDLGEEYIVLIDEERQRFRLCSSKCMDELFESMEGEEEEEY